MLELPFTNEIEMMGDVDANDTPVSDHKRVEIDTGYSMSSWHIMREQSDGPGEPLRQLNFHSKKVNWEVIIEEMRAVQWNEKLKDGSVLANTRVLMDKITEICQANIPKKGIQYFSSSKIKREKKSCSIGSGCLRETNIENSMREYPRMFYVYVNNQKYRRDIDPLTLSVFLTHIWHKKNCKLAIKS